VWLRFVAGGSAVGHDALVSASIDPHDPLHQQVFRPRFAPILAYVWYLVALLLAVDLLRRGDSTSILVGLGMLTLITVALYAGAQRPSVIVDDLGITLRNLMRDVYVPWHDVQRVGAVWSLTVETSHGEFRSWAVTASNPQRVRTRRRTAVFGLGAPPPPSFESMGGDTPEQLPGMVSATIAVRQERALRHEQIGGPFSVRLVWEVLIGAAVGVLLVVVGLLV
jgi:hypothetical protein